MTQASKWTKQSSAVKATQIAFEMEQEISRCIHKMAINEGLSTSSQIRKILGLSYSKPLRSRLTVSLSLDDYEVLGRKYKIDSLNKLKIKREMMKRLIAMFKTDNAL